MPLAGSSLRLTRATLCAPAAVLDSLATFYGDTLGLPVDTAGVDGVVVTVGESRVEFVASAGEPFYHLALLVPGDREEAAVEWIGDLVRLLPDSETGDTVFPFESWSGTACYFHDPAGTILELISLRGVEERGARGPFSAHELVGLSEVGLVGDPATMAATLALEAGIQVWDGVVDDPGRLGFAGERGRSIILCPPGRGWLPTGSPAERHRVELEVVGARPGETVLEDGLYRIICRG